MEKLTIDELINHYQKLIDDNDRLPWVEYVVYVSIQRYLEELQRYKDLEKLDIVHATHAATTEEEAWERLGVVDEGYLYDWYIHSVFGVNEPVWTEEHIKELYNDFIVIPRKIRLNEME